MKVLVTEADVTPEVLAEVEGFVEWFEDEPTMSSEDFIDRMFKYPSRWDIEDYDNPAARKIMRHARKIRKENRPV